MAERQLESSALRSQPMPPCQDHLLGLAATSGAGCSAASHRRTTSGCRQRSCSAPGAPHPLRRPSCAYQVSAYLAEPGGLPSRRFMLGPRLAK